MIKTLTFLPSSKRAIASRGKNLLQIGLSAGLKLRYNCANGSCGECKATLLAGTTRQTQHSDYCLSETERCKGELLMCCHEPDWGSHETEISLNVVEEGQDEPIDEQCLKLNVTRLELAAPDVMLVFCKTTRGQSLYFRAGQRVCLTDSNGGSLELFVASCPCDGKFLEFHVHRQKNSHFAEFVFGGLKKGVKLQLCGPFGDVSLRESMKPLVFIAWDFLQALQKMPEFLPHRIDEADFYCAVPDDFKSTLSEFLQSRGVAFESMFFFDS